MADVLLVNSPIVFGSNKDIFGDEVTDPPLGPLYIAAYLEQHDISVTFCDVTAQKLTVEDILNKINEVKPRVIGISALSSSIRSALQLATAIKEKWGIDAPLICLGGPHISGDPDFIKRFPVFDCGVVGEGEKAMLKIIQDIKAGKKVEGIIYAEPILNLDELPFPARHLADISSYHRGAEDKLDEKKFEKYKRASMIGSRGCPFQCCFCSRSVHKKNYRFRSAANIVREMEEIYDKFNGNYLFHDDTFTLNRENIVNFCKLIKQRGLKIRWGAMTRANCVNEELIKMLAESGCFNLFFGVESGNERIRNQVIQKNVNDIDIFNAIKWCRKYGIQSNIFLMLGFPTETLLEIEDTVNFARKAQPDVMGIHVTVILPGSDLYATGVAEKRIDHELIDKYARGELGTGFRSVWPLYIPEGLTHEQLIEAKKRAYRKFYLDPRWIGRRIIWDLKKPKFLFEDLRLAKAAGQAILFGGTKSAMS